MRKLNPKILVMAMLLGTMPMLVTCEAQNPMALMIFDAMALTPKQQCQIQPGQRAQAIIPYGILDVLLTNRYYLFPRFKNVMVPLSSITGEGSGSLQSETNILSVAGAKVWIDLGALTPALGDADYNIITPYILDGVQNTVAESVEPDQEGTVAVEVIKPEVGNFLGEMLRATDAPLKAALDVNVYVLLQAETQSGEVVYSNEFAFPIKVCYGCLVIPTVATEANEMPCNYGQDFAIIPVWCPPLAIWPEDCPVY
jgi:hypothetical protein